MTEQKIKLLGSVQEVDAFETGQNRRLHSATHAEILAGATSDIYFVKTQDILRQLQQEDTVVTAEIFGRKPGLLVGVEELLGLLKDAPVEVWALPEGCPPRRLFAVLKGVMRILAFMKQLCWVFWPAAAAGLLRLGILKLSARTSRFPALARGIFTRP